LEFARVKAGRKTLANSTPAAAANANFKLPSQME